MKIRSNSRTRVAIFASLALIASAVEAQSPISDNCEKFQADVKLGGTLDDRQRDRVASSSHLTHTFLWENDLFAGGGDLHYTNGMKLSWLHSPCRHRHEWLKGKYRSFLESIFTGSKYRVYSGGLVGMNMYTPEDLATPDRVRTDRPYAGWLYAGWNLQASTLANGEVTGNEHQLEIQFGFTGGKTAQREIQEFIHRNWSHSQMPQGWDNQVDQRLGFNFLYAHRWDRPPSASEEKVRVVPHAGFSFGNLIQFANAGAMLMLGNSASDYPGTAIQPLRQDIGIMKDEIQSQVLANGKTEPVRVVEVRPKPVLYAFVGLDARYIVNSVFVEGFGESKHEIDLVPGVYDLMAGGAWGGQRCRLVLKIIHRSKEFTSTDKSLEKSHRIGQINLNWYF